MFYCYIKRTEHAITFGQMSVYAINRFLYPYLDVTELLSVEEFQQFGDPTLSVQKNIPPEKPKTPEGKTTGLINKNYSYITSSTDVEMDKIYFIWDWGDGKISECIGPYNSRQICEINNSWEEVGDFEIKVKSIDQYGAESEWSDPLTISMPRSRSIEYSPWLFRLIQRLPIIEDLLLE